jgi:hypothetical protein
MNVYKQCMLGLEDGIRREISDILHNVCAGGGVVGNQARDRLRTVKLAAIRIREVLDEEERNANEVSGAEASHVRGSVWQKHPRHSAQGSEGIRGSGQAREATEIRPQIEKTEGLSLDYKGSDP